ncbi:hypothetical protein KIW84_011909 [Lathyrus oleraceus]|uniref:Uncharacterized protein n=1 Tax=Pisum sativum TaxID=3888 RepID=A0A9D5BG49_PEA|nr:hypothetical protein KIW84_011909 [Pisum sativum]
MEKGKSIDRADMVLGLFLDSMIMEFPNQVVTYEKTGDSLKKENKQKIDPSRFPYSRKHDPHATCGYHTGYVGNSTETWHVLKARVQELIN